MFQVNQDCLENTFSVIRSMGGAKTHPNPLEFATRFRIVKVTNNITALVSHKANVKPAHDDNIDHVKDGVIQRFYFIFKRSIYT